MRVAARSSTFDLSWVDPVVAAAMYPDTLPWHTKGRHTKGKPDSDSDDPTNAATEAALIQATWWLWSLTRGMLHGAECWVEDYRLRSCEVRLRRSPIAVVDHIELVRRCGREVEPLTWQDWCMVSANTVSFCCNCRSFNDSCGGCGGTVARVYYSTESNFPPGTESLVAWLAGELSKATQGKNCALPERVSSVTRQGVSWTMLDPMDFLDKGLTGMGRVDQWLNVARNVTGRAELIDPLRSDLVFSQRVECAGGQFGDRDVSDPKKDPFSDDFDHN